MNLEFRHEIQGLWGYYEVSEHCWCFDEEVLNKAFREFRKDKSAVLWAMDVSSEIDYINLIHISMSWDSWQEYDNKIVTLTLWKNFNDEEYRKVKWEQGKTKFREVIEKAKEGDVKVADIFKPQKVY